MDDQHGCMSTSEPDDHDRMFELLDPRSLKLGFKGGIVATCVMTVFRMPISYSLPPTAEFWAQYISGGELANHRAEALLLHLSYGAIAGCVFASIFSVIDTHSPFGTEANGLLAGLLYSIPFTILGEYVLLNRMLDMDLDPDESMIFHASHCVYGITLGAWIGSRM